jgi:hypothetical protein
VNKVPYSFINQSFGAHLIPGRTQELLNVKFHFPPFFIPLLFKKKIIWFAAPLFLMHFWVSNYF